MHSWFGQVLLRDTSDLTGRRKLACRARATFTQDILDIITLVVIPLVRPMPRLIHSSELSD